MNETTGVALINDIQGLTADSNEGEEPAEMPNIRESTTEIKKAARLRAQVAAIVGTNEGPEKKRAISEATSAGEGRIKDSARIDDETCHARSIQTVEMATIQRDLLI